MISLCYHKIESEYYNLTFSTQTRVLFLQTILTFANIFAKNTQTFQ